MSERATFAVEMELDSDGIFGSGYSIPGGDDINTTIDKQGYPYLKGSTLKGLLAESLYNLLAWTGGSEADYTALMGEEGWSGTADERRVQLTDMTLISRPVQPEEVFSSHTFTALEKIGMAGKVIKVVPSEAFFGLLLNSDPYRQLVVRSDGRSIFQHDPLTWLVDGNHFSLSKDVARTSKLATKSIQRWLGNLSIEQRREFVDSLYDVITQTRQSTLPGLKHYLRLNWATVVKNIKNSDPAVREAISKTLKLLIKSSLIEIRSSISGVFR